MQFYSFEMVLVGIILLSAMAAGGIKIWLKKKRASLEHLDPTNDSDSQQNPGDSEKTTHDRTRDS